MDRTQDDRRWTRRSSNGRPERLSKRQHDQVRRDLAPGLRASAPKQQTLATWMGVDPSVLSRQINGERTSHVHQTAALLVTLAREGKGRPGQIVARFLADMADTVGSDLSLAEMFHALAEVQCEEQEAEGAEDLSQARLMMALSREPRTEVERHALRFALQEHEARTIDEMAAALHGLIHNRAIQAHYGWRVPLGDGR